MAVLANTGTFSVSATGSKVVTGVGFQPKVIIIWHASGPGSLYHVIGVAASASEEWTVSAFSQDGTGTSNTFCAGRDDATINLRDGAVVYVLANLTSFDSDGFTLNVTTSSGTQVLDYLALGGDDLVDVQAGTTLVPASGSTHAVTGVGFQPDLVLFSYVGQQDWPSTGFNAMYGMGAMTADAQASSYGWTDNNVGVSQTNSYQLDDAVVLLATGAAPAQFLRWSRSSLDSDGFTLSLDDLGTLAADLGYVALKFSSPNWVKLGKETQPTSAQTKQTSGLGLTPAGLLLFGCMLATSTSPQNEGNFTIGAWDGSHNFSYAVCDADGADPMNCDRRASVTKAIQKINGSATMLSEADVSGAAFDSFTLNWTTADAVAREFFYIAMGAPEEIEEVLFPNLSLTTVA